MTLAAEQQSEFTAYSYRRACLYFAVAALESCLNQARRAYLEAAGKSEEEVYKDLRRKRFEDKQKWPEEMYGKSISVGKALSNAYNVRNEVTHPKRRDHSIYEDLDAIDLPTVVDDLSTYIVSIKQAARTPFPYWLLGWNYVVVMGKDVQVLELNNMNCFYYSLRNMGVVTSRHLQSDWDQKNMVSPACFRTLKSVLGHIKDDIEPAWEGFPLRNRLTRRWWDEDFIMSAWAAAL